MAETLEVAREIADELSNQTRELMEAHRGVLHGPSFRALVARLITEKLTPLMEEVELACAGLCRKELRRELERITGGKSGEAR